MKSNMASVQSLEHLTFAVSFSLFKFNCRQKRKYINTYIFTESIVFSNSINSYRIHSFQQFNKVFVLCKCFIRVCFLSLFFEGIKRIITVVQKPVYLFNEVYPNVCISEMQASQKIPLKEQCAETFQTTIRFPHQADHYVDLAKSQQPSPWIHPYHHQGRI